MLEGSRALSNSIISIYILSVASLFVATCFLLNYFQYDFFSFEFALYLIFYMLTRAKGLRKPPLPSKGRGKVTQTPPPKPHL